jgi:hypothetical protein
MTGIFVWTVSDVIVLGALALILVTGICYATYLTVADWWRRLKQRRERRGEA